MSETLGQGNGPWGPRMKFVLIGFGAIGAFFLLAEHRAHVLPYLPWLLLAACPLLHVFGHGGHGHGGQGSHRRDDSGSDRAPEGGGGQS